MQVNENYFWCFRIEELLKVLLVLAVSAFSHNYSATAKQVLRKLITLSFADTCEHLPTSEG
jgi:hypothetical protein